MSKNKTNKPLLSISKNKNMRNQMDVEVLARAICKAEGKNPDRLYNKKPLWEHNIAYAALIITELNNEPINSEKKEKPISNAEYEEKLKIGVQRYIEVFNEGTPRNLGEYVSVKEMHPAVLFLHMNSLKAAISGMLKNG